MSEKRTNAPTKEEMAQFNKDVFARLYDGKLLSHDKIKGLLQRYYDTVLTKPIPSVVVIKESPLSAWQWIQQNKCEDKNMSYIDPSGIMFDYAGYYSYIYFLYSKKFMILEDDLAKKVELANEMLDIYKIWSFDDCAVVSQKPVEIHMVNGVLHNPKGMSVKFLDGFGTYSLNGIAVPEYVINQDTFTKDEIINEKNADVRREIVRKIGIQKTIEILGAKVEDEKIIKLESGQELKYELLLLDLGDKIGRPYLKMQNPSMQDIYHVEGVHPDCKTVEDALAFRNGTKELPRSIS